MKSKQRIAHTSFHKNLTVYYKTVATRFAICTGRKMRHFNSLKTKFLEEGGKYDIASINNHYLSETALKGYSRRSIFLRDPRDLVVSGYFYHKAGREAWCNIKNPTLEDWDVVNGVIPTRMAEGESFSECLNRLSLTEGLLAELEFRGNHFDAMSKLVDCEDCFIAKYEDILGNEKKVFGELSEYYGFSAPERVLWCYLANRYASSKVSSTHIRNPKIGQYSEVFPAAVDRFFKDRYGDLLLAADYL